MASPHGQGDEPPATVPASGSTSASTSAPAESTAQSHPQPHTMPTPNAATPPAKRIRCLVVDTGPLIKNEPALSTLLADADQLYTIPSVLEEIKDEATRSRVQTTLLPFLKLRSPRPESVKFITDFARRTGDLEVLSKPDIHLLALCYELELQQNGGDWRLRNSPNQRELNGKPPAKEAQPATSKVEAEGDAAKQQGNCSSAAEDATTSSAAPVPAEASTNEDGHDAVEAEIQTLSLEDKPSDSIPDNNSILDSQDNEGSDDDDSDGWITPSNLKKHQAKDGLVSTPSKAIDHTLQAAILTSDFAMQNVALRINLNLVSPSNMSRITQLKTWVLRCYGCFTVTRRMDKQFCPKCGQATLTRTSTSTDSNGNMRLHLKKNFQYNKRGNVYSVPKPVHGTSSGKHSKLQGGGKDAWGADLILAEDQKEYQKKVEQDRQTRYHDLMDENYLPNILTGERTGGHGRIRVGAGRNVNAKKRR